ncbi:hypothetical protein GCM10010199_32290 [Dactylosporangium roseum]
MKARRDPDRQRFPVHLGSPDVRSANARVEFIDGDPVMLIDDGDVEIKFFSGLGGTWRRPPTAGARSPQSRRRSPKRVANGRTCAGSVCGPAAVGAVLLPGAPRLRSRWRRVEWSGASIVLAGAPDLQTFEITTDGSGA